MVPAKPRATTNSIDKQGLFALTGMIYDTVQATQRWPDVLRAMADAFDAKSGLVRTLDLRGGHTVLASHTWNLDETLQAEYRTSLVGEDPYVHALKAMPAGRIVTNDELVDMDQVVRSRYYHEYLAPQENHFIVGGFIESDEEGRYTIMGLQRHRGARRFSRSEVEAIQQLTPHMKRAVRLDRMLRHERQRVASAESALDSLCVAALLLDRGGNLVHANRPGERLLRCEQGLHIQDGRVCATSGDQAAELSELIERARHAVDGKAIPVVASMLLTDGSGGAPDLLAVVAPLVRPDAESDLRDEWPHASIALYVGDLDDTGLLRPDILRDLYHLTDAEARLAVAIGRGRELPELAECWQVSVETLRCHLKSVFAKAGVHRQTDLVRLLAGTPWKLAAPLDHQADPP